jgi:hypothetical protein
VEALKKGYFQLFDKWVFVGGHAYALKRKIGTTLKTEISILKKKSAPEIMAQLTAKEKGEVVLVGMGNMAGAGQELVKYWARIGKPYDL